MKTIYIHDVLDNNSWQVIAGSYKNDRENHVMIVGNDSPNTIENYRGDYVTIDGGKGNDSIRNSRFSEPVSIKAGEGNDEIWNAGDHEVTIDGDAGNDSISNYGDNVNINAGAGDDTVLNKGHSTTINGGVGNDFIQNDTIENKGNNVNINAGAGDDTIQNNGSNVLFTTLATATTLFTALTRLPRFPLRADSMFRTRAATILLSRLKTAAKSRSKLPLSSPKSISSGSKEYSLMADIT